MDFPTLLLIILFAIAGSLIYIIIGIIPGTDETSVLVPALILLLSLNVNYLVVLAFFIAAVVSLNLTDSIPTALTSIPGGVMSTPLVEQSKYLKEEGLVTKSIQKMTTGSLYGTIVAFISSVVIIVVINFITNLSQIPIKDYVNTYSKYIFLAGAILLSLLSKKKWISLIVIIPFGLLILGVQKLDANLSATPFFLSITTGPLIFQLFLLIFKKNRNKLAVEGKKELKLVKDVPLKRNEFFKILGGPEVKPTIIASFFSTLLFYLSPVGVTMLLGEMTGQRQHDKKQKALTQVSVMNGVANATYLSGIMISLFAFGIPISPAAAGPAGPLFDPDLNFSANIKISQGLLVVLIAAVISLFITVYLTLKYASKMTEIVFKYISQEVVIALLIALVILLVYLEAGFVGLLLILGVSLIAGLFNKLGVSYGVLFMAFYARSVWSFIFGG